MPYHKLRQAGEYTKMTFVEILDCTLTEVSDIERDADLYVNTLRRYVEAIGGDLEIIARFPEGDARVTQFQIEKREDD